MKALIILLFTLLVNESFSQKVFSVNSKMEADVKVYVVKSRMEADLYVFKLKNSIEVRDNNGQWFFTTSKMSASKKIYFVDSKMEADLKIYFVDNRMEAGWASKEKMYLMY